MPYYSGRRLEWQRLQWQSATVTVLAIPDSLVLKDKLLLWQKIGYSDTPFYISIDSKIVIFLRNIEVKMAYESLIMRLSKKVSWPQLLYKFKLTVQEAKTWLQVCPRMSQEE